MTPESSSHQESISLMLGTVVCRATTSFIVSMVEGQLTGFLCFAGTTSRSSRTRKGRLGWLSDSMPSIQLLEQTKMKMMSESFVDLSELGNVVFEPYTSTLKFCFFLSIFSCHEVVFANLLSHLHSQNFLGVFSLVWNIISSSDIGMMLLSHSLITLTDVGACSAKCINQNGDWLGMTLTYLLVCLPNNSTRVLRWNVWFVSVQDVRTNTLFLYMLSQW